MNKDLIINKFIIFPLLGIGITLLSCEKEEIRPNILFAIADDMSYGHTSYDGYPEVKTPAFDKIANEGMVFTHAYVSTSSCSPSRASILTGRNGYELEEGAVLWSYLPEKFQVYPDILQQYGYHIGYTGKGWGPGNLDIANRKVNPAGTSYNEIKTNPVLSFGEVSNISRIDYFSNFKQFLNGRTKDQPFHFWFSAFEPHRDYQEGIGKLAGKDPSKIKVPDFFPDTGEVRNDILDYLAEIEWYDKHLLKMMSYLDSIGELDNTIVIMTSDNGMPFPRAKANLYEYGTHMPLAIRWGNMVPRIIKDFISFTDFAPTFLEAANIPVPESMSGKSFYNILKSKKSGQVDPERNNVVLYKERHAWVQPNGQCTPVRGYRKDNWLVIWNILPDMWPAGHPDPKVNFNLWPFGDVDNGPTKTEIMKQKNKKGNRIDYYDLSFGKRPEYELYDVERDPFQMNNIANDNRYAKLLTALVDEMKNKLRETNDPRLTGTGTESFEQAPYFGVLAVETGWMSPNRWELLNNQEKEEHLKKMQSELAINRKRLKELYEE